MAKGIELIRDFEEKVVHMCSCKVYARKEVYEGASKAAQEARNALIEYVEKLEKYAKEMETIIVAKSC